MIQQNPITKNQSKQAQRRKLQADDPNITQI